MTSNANLYFAATAFALACVTVNVHAQPMQPGQTVTLFSLTGVNQFSTGMSGGGSFSWNDATASLRVNRQLSPEWGAGVNLQYGYQHWSWRNPETFGGVAPWQGINVPLLGLSVSYAPTAQWRFSVNPSIEWAAETGVGTSRSATYGAVALATHTWSPDLTLGVGAGVFRQIDETRVFPFLAINWRVTDKLTLRNPLTAGPTGGAGLELTYQIDDHWNVGAGGAYRSYRFRLNDSGPFAGGIGQNRLIPVFARVSYQFLPGTRIDLYGIASTAGNVQAKSADGNQVFGTGYNTGFGFGLNLSHRF